MKKLVIIFLVLTLMMSLVVLGENSKKTDEKIISKLQEKDSVKVIVQLKGNTIKNVKSLNSVSADVLKKARYQFDNKIPLDVNSTELLELEADPQVESIQLVGIKKIFLQDSTALINATNTWTKQISGINLTGIGQTACILDTGVNFSHPDLLNKNFTCIIDCLSGACLENCSASDDNGHGTHVAGIIGANGTIKGVAPDSRLIGVRVCDSGGSCLDSDIRAGIDWCVGNYSAYNISVISMSLGGDKNYTSYCDNIDDASGLTTGINNAIAKNISVTVASGNNANFTAISSPACIQNATSVGATTKSDVIASYSNRYSLLKLFAPGSLINSTYNNGKYTTLSGTSMATPHVAGSILIINQFEKLQNNKILVPLQTEINLKNHGKNITDSSGNGLSFTRVDIFTALLYLDEKAPFVNLTSPSGFSQDQNLSFSCNATDHLQTKNLTIIVWNSTNSIINQTTANSTSSFTSLQLNSTLDYGTYVWNCLSSDVKGNSAFASANFSVTVGGVLTSLNVPTNNFYTNQNETNFNCSAQSQTSLKNVTLSIWNSTSSLVYNKTENFSGLLNESLFNYNLTLEQNYSWNCLAFNNQTNSSYSSSNRTIVLDRTKPVITLISPTDGDSSNTGTTNVIFNYNVTEINLGNCSLLINNAIDQTGTTIYPNQTNSFSKSLSAGTYFWSVNCTDSANNPQNTSTRTIIINTATVTSSGGGGGGGSTTTTSTPQVFSLSNSEIQNGKSLPLKAKDKVKFTENNQSHTLTLTQILNNRTTITIESDPITVVLKIGEIKKIDFNSDEIYDLEIIFRSLISESQANITIKQISEKILQKKIVGNNQTAEETNQTKENVGMTKLLNAKNLIILIILIAVGFFLAWIIKKHRR